MLSLLCHHELQQCTSGARERKGEGERQKGRVLSAVVRKLREQRVREGPETPLFFLYFEMYLVVFTYDQCVIDTFSSKQAILLKRYVIHL